MAASGGSCDEAVVVAFLQRYAQDHAAGSPRPLEEYLARYPGYEAAITREFERLTAADGADDTGGDGRYADRGELGRGGMGVVRRVYDRTMRRLLARKSLSPDATEHARSRFADEAQITGQLAHPGVVPIYEFGIDRDGQPFFTMPLIRGRSLMEVIDLVHGGDEEWSMPRALGVIVRVCEAIAFAHDRGVIHRDLKPANVMVGEFGETYVMDWGLARVVDGAPDATEAAVDSSRAALESDSPLLTLDGDVLGTPAYMSPEQARGDVGAVAERSDVFAIGAMLYHLLAGEMPYAEVASSSREVLDRVRVGPPKPLESFERVPPELAAICRRATAREPGDRYASAAQLGDDLRAFLEVRVVRAYETGALAEARKWIARNRIAASASAIAMLALVGGLVVSLVQKSRADAQTVRAESNFRLAFDAVDRILERVGSERLQHIQQTLEVQRELLQDVLEFHEKFLESRGDDPEVTRETVAARTRLGLILKTLGRLDEAERAYLDAVRMAEQQVREHPGDAQRLVVLAATRNGYASCLADRDEYEQSVLLFRSAVESLDAAIESDPGQLEPRRRRARALQNLGTTLLRRGDHEEALAAWQAAVAGYSELVDIDGSAVHRFELARTHGSVAVGLRQVKRNEEARIEYRRCLDGLDALLAADPKNRDYRLAAGYNRVNLGDFLRRDGDHASASDQLTRAVDTLRGLVADHPGAHSYRGWLGRACASLAQTIRRTDPQRAVELLVEAVREERKALDAAPENGVFQRSLSSQLNRLASILVSRKEYERAAARAEELGALSFGGHAPGRQGARLLFRCATLALEDEDKPANERRALASRYEERAFALLDAAVDQGFADAGWLRHEWFDAARERPEFEALVRRIEGR